MLRLSRATIIGRSVADPAPDTVLVVPCYNEAARLRLDAFAELVEQTPHIAVRFVDDGSSDSTRQILARFVDPRPDRFALSGYAINRGKGEAVRHGIRAALAEPSPPRLVGYWDADLATPLDEAIRFRETFAAAPELRAILGSRVRLLGRSVERRTSRHIAGRGFATFVALLLDLRVYDTQCGAKMFAIGDDIVEAFETPFVTRWIFDVEVIIRLLRAWDRTDVDSGEAIAEVPLRRWSEVAGSKLGWTDAAQIARELRALHAEYGDYLRARRHGSRWT